MSGNGRDLRGKRRVHADGLSPVQLCTRQDSRGLGSLISVTRPLDDTSAIASPPSSVVHSVPWASRATPVGDVLFMGSVTYVACRACGAAVDAGLDVVRVDRDPHAASTPTAIAASSAASMRGSSDQYSSTKSRRRCHSAMPGGRLVLNDSGSLLSKDSRYLPSVRSAAVRTESSVIVGGAVRSAGGPAPDARSCKAALQN